MISYVLDASITMAWCFEDEATSHTKHLLQEMPQSGVIVPAIWSLEIANVLAVAERKRKISTADSIKFVALLDELPIIIDDVTSKRALHEILSLARAEDLTAYDAAYLELAMRNGLALATKDVLLKKAAKRLGLDLVV